MRTHVRVAAVLFLAASALFALIGVFSTLSVLQTARAIDAEDAAGAVGATILSATGVGFALFAAVFVIPTILCGWGLLKFRRWARVLAIVLASILLFVFPLGSMLGVYVLWVLFTQQTEPLFGD